MAQETLRGHLLVTMKADKKTGRETPIYRVRFTDSRGATKEMPLCTEARWFQEADATPEAPVVIVRENGKLLKVTIEGKAEIAPEPPKAATKAGWSGSGKNGQKAFGNGSGGGYQNRQGSGGSGRSGGYGSGNGSAGKKLAPATAPYNFVAQHCILEAPQEDLRETRYSGSITCSLEALTPLLVAGEQKEPATETTPGIRSFFTVQGRYVIPGSTLKGLLRSAVETLSCSSMEYMNDRRIFWRSFDDQDYKQRMHMGRRVDLEQMPQRAGYLVRHGAEFEIIPVHYTPIDCRAREKGTRVCTGSMQKKRHDYDFDPCPSSPRETLTVNDDILDDFVLQMTPYQEKHIEEVYGITKETGIRRMSEKTRLPVFFITDEKTHREVEFLGLARYFRLPKNYSPKQLRDGTIGVLPEKAHDLAEQLFGYADRTGSRRGRVSFSPCVFPERTREEVLPDTVLGTPHPTCFAHYLDQSKQQLRTLPRNPNRYDVNSLSSYNDAGTIRGRKFYWHRDPEVTAPPNENTKTQSRLKPLVKGSVATCTVHLDSVTLIELGVVLEGLLLPEGHAHKLGMGKSMGLGSVRITALASDLAADQDAYTDLMGRCRAFFGGAGTGSEEASGSAGGIPDSQKELCAAARNAFQSWLLAALTEKGYGAASYEKLPVVCEFRRMTDFDNRPSNAKTQCLKLEEFRNLRVLGTPLEI